MDDIEDFKEKLYAGLGVPKKYVTGSTQWSAASVATTVMEKRFSVLRKQAWSRAMKLINIHTHTENKVNKVDEDPEGSRILRKGW